jgi:serine/threonine-protein kinase
MLVEPALLARLKHPCIVGLEDYFLHGGKLVLALEFVPGEDLKALIDRDDPVEPELVRDLLVQLASALTEAHAQQIVHRDIKPSNILVDTTGGRRRFVLTDFGVGRRAEGLQAEKHVGGTYSYMAPEQLRGRPGPQSDLWALGVVAYQLLTGKLPFPGPSLGELAKQIQYDDPPPPSTVATVPIPGDLERTVLGLLTKSLTERIGSAKQVLELLGVRGDTRRVFDTVIDSKRTTRRQLPLARKLARDAGRAKWIIGIMVVLYVLANGVIFGALFVLGLWLFFRNQRTDRPIVRQAAGLALAFAVLVVSKFGPNIFQDLTNWVDLGDMSVKIKQQLTHLVKALGPAGQIVLVVAVLAVAIFAFFIPIIGSAAYVNLRRVRREQALLDASVAGRTGSDEFLTLMRDMLDTRFEDVGFHLRYAEMLFARGDVQHAAIEARLITRQDPYHFNANLLLANAYYSLGLYADCRDVCADYLRVAGYCFEFQELNAQCVTRLGRA